MITVPGPEPSTTKLIGLFQIKCVALTVEGDMVVEVVLNVVDEEEHALVTAEHW